MDFVTSIPQQDKNLVKESKDTHDTKIADPWTSQIPEPLAEEKINTYHYHPLSYYGNPIRILGKGAFGEVQLHQKDRKMFAIKWQDFDSQSIIETSIFKGTNHPNILGIYDIIFSNNLMGIVLPFANFGSLFNVIHEKKCPGETSIIYQLLCGMSYLHANQIYHRDLKPDNILVSREDNQPCEIKIGDFGLSTFSKCSLSKIIPNEQLVTLYYRPPETILDGIFNEKSDMFSVGCIIYEILTGKIFARGLNEIEQLWLIFQKLGTPTEATWPGVAEMEHYRTNLFPSFFRKPSSELYPDIDSKWYSILSSLLVNNPSDRKNAYSLLWSPNFDSVRKIENEIPLRGCSANLVLRKPTDLMDKPFLLPISTRQTIIAKNYMMEMWQYLDVLPDPWVYAIQLFDRTVDKLNITTQNLQFFSMACLNIGIKVKENEDLDLEIIMADSRPESREQIPKLTVDILKILSFDLMMSTAIDFISVCSCELNVIHLAQSLLPLIIFLDDEKDPETIANILLTMASLYLGSKVPEINRSENIRMYIRNMLNNFKETEDAITNASALRQQFKRYTGTDISIFLDRVLKSSTKDVPRHF